VPFSHCGNSINQCLKTLARWRPTPSCYKGKEMYLHCIQVWHPILLLDVQAQGEQCTSNKEQRQNKTKRRWFSIDHSIFQVPHPPPFIFHRSCHLAVRTKFQWQFIAGCHVPHARGLTYFPRTARIHAKARLECNQSSTGLGGVVPL